MQNPSPLSTLIHSQAKRYGERAALRWRDYESGCWNDISWNDFSLRVRQVSNALLELGVRVQENVVVFSQNMPECLYVDFGAYAVRAVTIPFYATSSEMQVKYMVGDARAISVRHRLPCAEDSPRGEQAHHLRPRGEEKSTGQGEHLL